MLYMTSVEGVTHYFNDWWIKQKGRRKPSRRGHAQRVKQHVIESLFGRGVLMNAMFMTHWPLAAVASSHDDSCDVEAPRC